MDDILLRSALNTDYRLRLVQTVFKQVVGEFPLWTDVEVIMASEKFKKCYRALVAHESRFERRSDIDCMVTPVVTEDEARNPRGRIARGQGRRC